MKKLMAILILFLLNGNLFSAEPEGRIAPTLTNIGNGEILLFGGNTGSIWSSGVIHNDLWKFTYEDGIETWEELSPGGITMPGITEHTAVLYDNNIFIIGGYMASNLGNAYTDIEVYKYSVDDNSWSKVTFAAGAVPDRMNSHIAEVIGDLIYVNFKDQTWSFDPSDNSWTRLADSPTYDRALFNYQWHNAAVYEDKLVIYRNGEIDNGEIQIYDTSTNTWEVKIPTPVGDQISLSKSTENPTIPVGTWGSNYWFLGDYAYTGGGRNASTSQIIDTFWRLNMKDNTWEYMPGFSDFRYHGAAEMIDDKTILIAGGVEDGGGFSSTKILTVVPPGSEVELTTSVLPNEAAQDGCSVTPAGVTTQQLDATVNLSATAVNGWVFNLWTGDVTGSNPVTSLVMNGDKIANGNFLPTLTLSMTSDSADHHAPPENNYDAINIADVNLAAGGVDWQLHGLEFTATSTVQANHAHVWLRIGDENTIEGEIIKDINNNIVSLNFNLTYLIMEGSVFSGTLLYTFDFPKNEYDLVAPIDKVKYLSVSINRNQVNCDPVPNIVGLKIPEDTFQSDVQTIASIWNVSQNYLPYSTIQDAIDAANTNNNDSIEVWKGLYMLDTTVTVNKSVKLAGIGDSVYINSPNDSALIINNNNISINNFNFESLYDIITLREFSNISIKNSCFRLVANSTSGISGISKKDISIINNEFVILENSHFSKGIWFKFCNENIIIENNIFDQQNKELSDWILVIQNSKKGKIVNNKFINCAKIISSLYSSDLDILNNELKDCNILIDVRRSKNISIKGNSINNQKLLSCESIIFKSDSIVFLNNSTNSSLKLNLKESDELEISDNFLINNDDYFFLELKDCKNVDICNNPSLFCDIQKLDFIASIRNKNIHISGNELKKLIIMESENINIENNTISNFGASVYYCKDIYINKNLFMNCINTVLSTMSNKGNCYISSNRSLENKQGFDFSQYSNETYKLEIKNNFITGSQNMTCINVYGISNNFKIVNNTVKNSDIGIKIDNSINGYVASNTLLNNCSGLKISESKNIKVAMNNIIDSWCLFTGIHADNSTLDISQNNLDNNAGAAIGIFNDAEVEIKNNNIINNPDLAIYNENPEQEIDANGNYWGNNTEPDNALFSGNILFNNWLLEPISLVVDVSLDTLYLENGLSDSVTVSIANFKTPNDQVRLNIEDKEGWLEQNINEEITLNDSMFTTRELYFEIPENGSEEVYNKVILNAESLNDKTVTAIDSFYIMSYEPELVMLDISPDSTVFGFGDTLYLDASGYDQNGIRWNDNLNINWSASYGTIDSNGFYICDSLPQVVEFKAIDEISGITEKAYISISPHKNYAEIINISPDSISVFPNDQIRFIANGFDHNGFHVDFEKQWTAVGGIIDSAGNYTASETPGIYEVVVTDTNSHVSETSIVEVKGETAIDNVIIPESYYLSQNYPNPFNPTTTITYSLPYDSNVKIEIYNLLGQKVDVLTNTIQTSGYYKLNWHASTYSTGIYLLKMRAISLTNSEIFLETRKMILLK